MSLILPLRMFRTLTVISSSLPEASLRRIWTRLRLARSVNPPAWAMAWVRVGRLDRLTCRAPGFRTCPKT